MAYLITFFSLSTLLSSNFLYFILPNFLAIFIIFLFSVGEGLTARAQHGHRIVHSSNLASFCSMKKWYLNLTETTNVDFGGLQEANILKHLHRHQRRYQEKPPPLAEEGSQRSPGTRPVPVCF